MPANKVVAPVTAPTKKMIKNGESFQTTFVKKSEAVLIINFFAGTSPLAKKNIAYAREYLAMCKDGWTLFPDVAKNGDKEIIPVVVIKPTWSQVFSPETSGQMSHKDIVTVMSFFVDAYDTMQKVCSFFLNGAPAEEMKDEPMSIPESDLW